MSIKAIATDFSRVLLFPKVQQAGRLNKLYTTLKSEGSFSFWDHFELNQELLDFYQTLNKRLPVYIFTSGYVQEAPELADILASAFSGVYSAARLDVHKSDRDAHRVFAETVGCQPNELIFIDDQEQNIAAAKAAGCRTHIYSSNQALIAYLNEQLGV